MPQATSAPVVLGGATQGAPVTVTYPGGAIPLTGIPQNEQEVQGLRSRIDILEEQIDEATSQRDELAREIRNGIPEGAARTGIEQRITQIDQHIMQLERDQQLAERQLSATSAELLATTEHYVNVNEIDLSNRMDEDEAAFIAFMTFGAGIIVTTIVGRIRRRKWRQNATAQAMSSVGASDPRIERLTQAVDAIAEEVERIGEGQRFVTTLLADRRDAVPIARGADQR